MVERLSCKQEEPIDYWQKHNNLKTLSVMASDILYVPATSVPVECLFS